MISQGFGGSFAAAEKTELWDRWQRGESLKAIGQRLVSRHHLFISSLLRTVDSSCGTASRETGIDALEREEISRGIAAA